MRHIKNIVYISFALFFLANSVLLSQITEENSIGEKNTSMTNPFVIANTARFTIIAPECIRLEYSENGQFIDEPSLTAVNRNAYSSEFRVDKIQENIWKISTSRMQITYQPNGKPFSKENIFAMIILQGDEKARWVPDMVNQGNLGGTVRTLDQARGKIPLEDGILSRDGWYLLDDSRRPILASDWVQQRPKDAGIDWYLFGYGLNYKAALQAFTKIAGQVPMPRKYVLGSWYSRYWPYSSAEYRQIIEEYRQHDFPLDVIVMDMDWHKDGWTGWSWNRKLLPDAEELLQWFHQQNLAVTLNLHPADGVKPHEDRYIEFMKELGEDVGKTIPFDSSNQKYISAIFKHIHEPLEKQGVDFWWLDWQQFEPSLGNPELKNLEWLNYCYFKHTGKNEERRGTSFSRWGGWGDHKHPIHFSGDAVSIWDMLEFEVPFTATAGNVGCFFWSHDIGGHFGGLTPETNTRWIQFGALTAALRLHSTHDATMDKRPWLMAEPHLTSMKKAFHLRSILMPYIYSSVWQSCQNTIPLTRSMYIEYPEKEISYHSQPQYLFGDALLVAPITRPGTGPNKVASQRVWFPPGAWYNWFTGERCVSTGENFTNVWADITEFPLYVKGGIPIPLQKYTQRMASEPLKHLIVRVYPGPNNSFTLYEDDGISQAYKKGIFATTQIQYRQTENIQEIIIEPVRGTYTNQPQERSYTIEFGDNMPEEIVQVLYQGQPIDYTCNNKEAICRVEIPAQSISQKIHIQLHWGKVSISHSIQQGLPILYRWQKLSEGMASINDENLSLEKILSEIKDWPKNNRDNILSFLSEISLHKEDNQIIHLICNAGIAAVTSEVKVIDYIGSKEIVLASKKLQMYPGSRILEIPDPFPDTFGMPFRREIQVTFPMENHSITLTSTLEERDTYLPECLLLGPFKFQRKENIQDYTYDPEKVKPENLLTHSYIGKNNKALSWKKVKCTPSYEFDLGHHLRGEDAIGYGLVFLDSEIEQDIQFYLNSDDGIELFLNGEKILSKNVLRSSFHDPDLCKGKLKTGRNAVLFKVSQGMGGWCFKAKICTQHAIKYSLE